MKTKKHGQGMTHKQIVHFSNRLAYSANHFHENSQYIRGWEHACKYFAHELRTTLRFCESINNQSRKENAMLAINKQSKNLGTIKSALFIATQVPELKGSKAWHSAKQLLNWIEQFNEDDTIVITNNENLTITKP